MHGDALGEGPDAAVARPPVDLVTHAEARHRRADAVHDAGEVVPEDERSLVRDEELELPVADLRVEHVDAGGVDLDEHVAVADSRLRGLAGPHRALVLLDEVGLHGNYERQIEGRDVVGRLRRQGHSALEELEDRGDELPVVLEDPAVPGVGIELESGIGQAPSQVGGVA